MPSAALRPAHGLTFGDFALPAGASIGLTDPPAAGVLAPAAAGAVLAGYAVAMLAVASRTTIRRDVG